MIEAFARAARYAVWLQLCRLRDPPLEWVRVTAQRATRPAARPGQRFTVDPPSGPQAASRSKGVRESGAADQGSLAVNQCIGSELCTLVSRAAESKCSCRRLELGRRSRSALGAAQGDGAYAATPQRANQAACCQQRNMALPPAAARLHHLPVSMPWRGHAQPPPAGSLEKILLLPVHPGDDATPGRGSCRFGQRLASKGSRVISAQPRPAAVAAHPACH